LVPAEIRLAERPQRGGEHRRGCLEEKTSVKARNNFIVSLEEYSIEIQFHSSDVGR